MLNLRQNGLCYLHPRAQNGIFAMRTMGDPIPAFPKGEGVDSAAELDTPDPAMVEAGTTSKGRERPSLTLPVREGTE